MPNTGNGSNYSSFFPVFFPLLPSILTAAVKNSGFPVQSIILGSDLPPTTQDFVFRRLLNIKYLEDSFHVLVLQLKKKKKTQIHKPIEKEAENYFHMYYTIFPIVHTNDKNIQVFFSVYSTAAEPISLCRHKCLALLIFQ